MPFNLRNFEEEAKAKMGVVECVSHKLIEPFQVLYEKHGKWRHNVSLLAKLITGCYRSVNILSRHFATKFMKSLFGAWNGLEFPENFKHLSFEKTPTFTFFIPGLFKHSFPHRLILIPLKTFSNFQLNSLPNSNTPSCYFRTVSLSLLATPLTRPCTRVSTVFPMVNSRKWWRLNSNWLMDLRPPRRRSPKSRKRARRIPLLLPLQRQKKLPQKRKLERSFSKTTGINSKPDRQLNTHTLES